MTPHIEAQKGDYAPIVLMPGDPLRAKWIAEEFLIESKQVNGVRNCLGYTGIYNGRKVSVQASGMGQPSLGIYAHELYNFYDVETIIRVGSCGGLAKNVKIGDIVVAMTASTDSDMSSKILSGLYTDVKFCPCADYELLTNFVDNVPMDKKCHVGSIVSTDYFYQPEEDWWKPLADVGILAVEMEAHLLYTLAMRFGKKALAVSTVSDHLDGGDSMSAQERQSSFDDMITTVLETVC
ncbi:MAG: purine-nucleoside phosphorylase [Euryarchaeota archaeon]|jgi:purine-nucleoside phosphorylase|nr:purine-nucleoside phosphorylase [Euryarchaeota archaeon]